jgi:ornithine cyclodeaminase/alanine dehydrogenase-like protein (mu-crystallin family)
MSLIAFKEIIPTLKKAKVFDIHTSAMKDYKNDLEKKTGIQIEITESVQSAVYKMDMILTATQRLKEPLIKDSWFCPGCLGFGLEAS